MGRNRLHISCLLVISGHFRRVVTVCFCVPYKSAFTLHYILCESQNLMKGRAILSERAIYAS